MADETTRVIKRKRIKLPDGTTVDIPIIAKISFLDASERGQETQYTIDNSADVNRDVRVATVIGGGKTDESGEKDGLKVERIDLFRLFDSSDRGQEHFQSPDSKTVNQPPDAPPYFTTHEKTHIVKYIKRNDDDTEDNSIWIKSELIDKWSFSDSPDRGRETQWTLFNPPDNQDIDGLRFGTDADDKPTISVDPSVEEITTGVGGTDEGDTPVRTDPFQNIVDFSTEEIYLAITLSCSRHFYQTYSGFTATPDNSDINWGPQVSPFDVDIDFPRPPFPYTYTYCRHVKFVWTPDKRLDKADVYSFVRDSDKAGKWKNFQVDLDEAFSLPKSLPKEQSYGEWAFGGASSGPTWISMQGWRFDKITGDILKDPNGFDISQSSSDAAKFKTGMTTNIDLRGWPTGGGALRGWTSADPGRFATWMAPITIPSQINEEFNFSTAPTMFKAAIDVSGMTIKYKGKTWTPIGMYCRTAQAESTPATDPYLYYIDSVGSGTDPGLPPHEHDGSSDEINVIFAPSDSPTSE